MPQETPPSPEVQLIRTGHSQSLMPIPLLDLDCETRRSTQTHTVGYGEDQLRTEELYQPTIDVDFDILADAETTT